MSDLQALQIIHESQSEDLAAEYARHKMKDEVEYRDTPLTAVDVNSLVFTLRHHATLHALWSVYFNFASLPVNLSNDVTFSVFVSCNGNELTMINSC